LVYEITGDRIEQIFKTLVGSCLKGMILDVGDGNDNDFSITERDNHVVFRWLTYPNTDLIVIGRYDFTRNKLGLERFKRGD
jgi:hypothetical protein